MDKIRVLFISHGGRICSSQIFPFFYYAREIAIQWNAELREVLIDTVEQSSEQRTEKVDVVCLQTWFSITNERLLRLLDRIHHLYAPRRIVFFDSFAPTDLRLAERLNPHIDLYVKKHVFRDRSKYGRPTLGDTNLMEYYGRLYGIDYPRTVFKIPEGFLDKLLVGPSFATADSMMPRFLSEMACARERRIDVHARLASEGTQWYSAMRKEAIRVIEGLDDLVVVSRSGTSRRRYLRELASAKICFSPFGYGEVAWRDYEAAMCGSLIVKPDMSHIETNPDIFVRNETYVPVKWDFSDVQDKIRYYLAHPREREEIAHCAYDVLHRYFEHGEFLRQMRSVVGTL